MPSSKIRSSSTSLNLSGNVGLTQTAAGSDGTGDTSGLANTLLAGNLSVYINDPDGNFTADELARIQDAINAWDAILAPYNVTITEVSDPSLANVVIDTGTTSACGGASSGVLGCYDGATGEITLIQNWNWYAGADPSQIGAGQYDFETTVTHELGHALGLGHSADPSSPMYATLATGVADRIPSTQDLNIPDPPDGADPQMAAGFILGPPEHRRLANRVRRSARRRARASPGRPHATAGSRHHGHFPPDRPWSAAQPARGISRASESAGSHRPDCIAIIARSATTGHRGRGSSPYLDRNVARFGPRRGGLERNLRVFRRWPEQSPPGPFPRLW